MDSLGLYLAVFIPLVVIILLAVFFYRLFAKNMNRDETEINRLRDLDELKKKAEFREARIISVRPEGQSNTSPANRFVNLRFEIKDNSGEFKMLSARWYVDTYYLSQLQPDMKVQVRVYDEYVFPVIDGARLYP
ncbi:MAG TPA: hypothetical protein VG961_06590 [Ignavibacteria bacterium]|nr:hypothetical protein [Ignavibacteria bacterium]